MNENIIEIPKIYLRYNEGYNRYFITKTRPTCKPNEKLYTINKLHQFYFTKEKIKEIKDDIAIRHTIFYYDLAKYLKTKNIIDTDYIAVNQYFIVKE